MTAQRCTCGVIDIETNPIPDTDDNLTHYFDGRPCHYEAPTLIDVVTALSDVYQDKGIAIWLGAEKRWECQDNVTRHGFTALEMIREGRIEDVMDAIERLQSGAAS